MFVALDFLECPKKNLFKRIFSRKQSDVSYEIKKIGSDEYYLITCKTYSGKANYDEIKRIAGSEAGRLVISRNVHLQRDCGLKAFHPDKFRREMLCNGTISVLKKAAIPPATVKIAVYDRTAQEPDFVLKLLPYSINLLVVTERADAYSQVRAKALSEYGAPISLAEDLRSVKSPDILIAFDRLPYRISQADIIFTCEAMNRGIKLIPCDVPIPENISKDIPPAFDKDYFYSALAQTHSNPQKYPIEPRSFIYGNSEIPVKKAAEIIKGLDNFCGI